MSEALPDILAPGLDVVFCGINPGLLAAQTGHHFAGHSNRFWRVLHLAGFTPKELTAEEDRRLLFYGCGITSVVRRATAGADDLSPAEFTTAAEDFQSRMEKYAPRVVAFLGKVAYSTLMKKRDVPWGRQTALYAGATAWVLPNPSGRNLAYSLADLTDAYSELRHAITTPAC